MVIASKLSLSLYCHFNVILVANSIDHFEEKTIMELVRRYCYRKKVVNKSKSYFETVVLLVVLLKRCTSIRFYQLPLILTALLHVDLISVGFLTVRAFIRS